MNYLVMLLTLVLVVSPLSFAKPPLTESDVWVKDYIRKDGTYVQPHYRSYPDGDFWNNWSSWGNYNPYTGKQGYKLPSYDRGYPRFR